VGHSVTPLGRSSQAKNLIFNLADSNCVPDLNGFDVLLHFAWQRSVNSQEDYEINIAGSRRILREALRSGAIPILLSTDSAENGLSRYGRAKRIIEQDFIQSSGIVLRCGIICGERIGGIFETIYKLSNLPFICFHLVPEPTLRIVTSDELATVIEELLTRPLRSQIINVGSTSRFSLSMISHVVRRKRITAHVDVSMKLLYGIASQMKRLPLTLPFDPDSLATFHRHSFSVIGECEESPTEQLIPQNLVSSLRRFQV
jgi:nucleoside-diphosphate-sugar epimerase